MAFLSLFSPAFSPKGTTAALVSKVITGSDATAGGVARLIYQAKLAEQAERFEEMAEFIDEVIKQEKNLDEEGRKLFTVAYKNCVGRIRTAWRVADTARARYSGINKQKEQMASEYADELGLQITQLCDRVEAHLKTLAWSAKDPETRLMYAKTEADYLRYRSEIHPKDAQTAIKAYQHATKLASEVPHSHPTRLGLALNYSVFKYEIENQGEEACKMAMAALTAAREEGIPDNRDAYLIEQLLQDNVNLWRSEQSYPVT